MKINKTPTPELIAKRDSLLRSWATTYKIENDKKTVKDPGKGDESASLHYRHISEELCRRDIS
ncbi:hypothetical protein EB093_08860 [bacterium]|nr:hypothetical protein [bacterium]